MLDTSNSTWSTSITVETAWDFFQRKKFGFCNANLPDLSGHGNYGAKYDTVYQYTNVVQLFNINEI